MDPSKSPTTQPPPNGSIHAVSKILRNVIESAAEAESGGLFINCREATILVHTLREMGHKQPHVPVMIENSTVAGIVNNIVKQRKYRSMDMRLYWVKDRIKQGFFIIYWVPGTEKRETIILSIIQLHITESLERIWLSIQTM